jgi:hypothetical protein
VRKLILPTFFLLLSLTGVGVCSADGNFVRFAGKTILLPPMEDYCLVTQQTEPEIILFRWMSEVQARAGNELFQIWLDCDDYRKVVSGLEVDNLENWFINFATLTGGQEERVSGISKREFQKQWSDAISNINSQFLGKRINEIFDEVNSIYLGDEKITLSEPVFLGVLAETDSVHHGLLMDVEGQTVAGILGITLINEVPFSQAFYSQFTRTDTFQTLLEKSKSYSTKLHQLNAEE